MGPLRVGGGLGWGGDWEKRGAPAGQGAPELSGQRHKGVGPARPFLACIYPVRIFVPWDAAFPFPPGAASRGGAAASRPFPRLDPARSVGRQYRRLFSAL